MCSSFVHTKRESLPVVPLRDMVVFPHMMAPFIVGRESSVRALEQALATPSKRIFLAAQKDPRIDDPLRDDICEMGVVATVIQNLKLPNGNVRVMVEGVQRGKIVEVVDTDGALNDLAPLHTLDHHPHVAVGQLGKIVEVVDTDGALTVECES